MIFFTNQLENLQPEDNFAKRLARSVDIKRDYGCSCAKECEQMFITHIAASAFSI